MNGGSFNTGCPTNIVTTSTLIFSFLQFHKYKSKTCSEKIMQKSSRGYLDLLFFQKKKINICKKVLELIIISQGGEARSQKNPLFCFIADVEK